MNNTTLTADVTSKVNLVKSIANKTRGPYTPENYGRVIIPMSIIRRFDCILADKNKDIRLVLDKAAAVKGIKPEQIEEMVKRQCGVSFYNAKCISLEQLVGNSDNLNANFLEFIGAYSPSIQRILQGLKFREEVEFMVKKGILFEVVKAFSEVDFHPSTTSPMAMGYIFEEIIRTYKANAEAGDHYTPREVIELCVELMMSENVENLKKNGKIIRVYDGCCGTGGMLTTLKRKLTDPEDGMGINPDNIRLYGQDVNPEAYAVCRAEMLMLDENPANIREGNTLTEDAFPGEKFDLLITNPPFGVEWKTEKSAVEKELKQPNNRFVAGTPRVSDGQLLFLQNLLSKAEDDARVAIILNGSPLFSGDAGSGESEIRRYVLENHLLEAIVALPDQMFYNTGIYTYIWILSKTPSARRDHKVQLIDATSLFVPQTPKSLGNKRKFIDETNCRKIVGEYTAFTESDISKIFDADDFGYTKVTMECPLYDEKGDKVIKRGTVQVDSSRRDTETIPLKQDIDAYIKAEVLPYVPDAFADRSKDKIGYEIPFTRYFYKYTAPRKSADILKEIIENEAALQEQRQSIIYEAVTKGLDPNAPMKDSGVEWIGEIPEGWSKTRAKFVLSITNGSDPKTDGDTSVYGSGLSCFKTCGESKNGPTVLLGRKGTVDIPQYIENKYWNVDTAFDTHANPQKLNIKYYFYLSKCFDYKYYTSTTTLPSMTQTNYGNMYIPQIAVSIQKCIADYLDAKCAEIDALIAANNTTIQKLKEYRQSVIYEVVTGKVEI